MLISYRPNKYGIAAIVAAILLFIIIALRKRKRLKQIAMRTINYIKEKTWDINSDRKIATLHPKIQAAAKEFIIRAEKELGIKLRVTSGFRSWTEQTELYNQGRTTAGKKVTNAKAGESLHNFGLAIDLVEIKNGQALWKNPNWDKIAALGKQIGFTWGGDWSSFKDLPHFEMRFGRSLSQLQQLYTSGKRSGEYVNLV